MITLLFHKYVLVTLWVLSSAEGTAVMRTTLALAFPEPTAQGKVEGESPEWSGLGFGCPEPEQGPGIAGGPQRAS